jgi:hypothetical protein
LTRHEQVPPIADDGYSKYPQAGSVLHVRSGATNLVPAWRMPIWIGAVLPSRQCCRKSIGTMRFRKRNHGVTPQSQK